MCLLEFHWTFKIKNVFILAESVTDFKFLSDSCPSRSLLLNSPLSENIWHCKSRSYLHYIIAFSCGKGASPVILGCLHSFNNDITGLPPLKLVFGMEQCWGWLTATSGWSDIAGRGGPTATSANLWTGSISSHQKSTEILSCVKR